MVELKDFRDELFKTIGVHNTEEFKKTIQQAIMEGNLEEILITYDSIKKEEHIDYIQRMYQFYLADREEKSQDFTPPSLADLCATLTSNKGKTLDLCGGVGRLTIEHNKLHNQEYLIEELDENVIPFLIFNLAHKNVTATVYQKNVLTGEKIHTYTLQRGQKYSRIVKKKQAVLLEEKPVNVISNPPFNLRQDKCTINGVEFRGLMNYAFIERAITESSDDAKIAFILPNGVLSSTQEDKYRKRLVDEHLLKGVINCPDGMFESTSIPVCVLYIDKNNKDDKITFIDAREHYDVKVRLQKGEGSASHRNRTYKKNMAIFTEQHIKEMVTAIKSGATEEGYYKTVTSKEVQENQYLLNSNRYIGFKFKEEKTRPYEDIITDINRVREEKNTVKLTINKVWLKDSEMEDLVHLHKQGNEATEDTNQFLKFMGLPLLLNEDWVSSSNSKVLKFENKNKNKLSSIFRILLPLWQQHIFYLNDEETRLLQELRDKLLPQLMSGEIDVSGFDEHNKNSTNTETENTTQKK